MAAWSSFRAAPPHAQLGRPPICAGKPAYLRKRDRDRDGTACE
ncbi:excalibur calcium-binding domain-containing protein [Sinorhizobium arboris]|nr:excalibur calcium-binding domain-containing protein [Sinorhizobium arboris]